MRCGEPGGLPAGPERQITAPARWVPAVGRGLVRSQRRRGRDTFDRAVDQGRGLKQRRRRVKRGLAGKRARSRGSVAEFNEHDNALFGA